MGKLYPGISFLLPKSATRVIDEVRNQGLGRAQAGGVTNHCISCMPITIVLLWVRTRRKGQHHNNVPVLRYRTPFEYAGQTPYMNNKDDGFRICMEILFRDSIEVLIFHRRDSFSSHAVWRRLNTKLLHIEDHLGTIHAERGVHFLALYFLSHSSFNLGEYEDTLAHTNNIVGAFNSICGGRLTLFC